MDITYRKEGDYYVPNIKAPEQIKGFKLEKYSGLRLQFLKEHRRGEYTYLLIENKLQSHLLEVQKNAKKEYEMLMKELKIKEQNQKLLKKRCLTILTFLHSIYQKSKMVNHVLH